MTIEQISDKLKLDYQVAYGFMKFLEQIGAATSENPPKTGKKGKPARLYRLTGDATARATEWLTTIAQMSEAAATERNQVMEARRKLGEVEKLNKARLRDAMAEAAKSAKEQVRAEYQARLAAQQEHAKIVQQASQAPTLSNKGPSDPNIH